MVGANVVVVVVGSENTDNVGNGVGDDDKNNEGVGGGEGNGTVVIITWSVVELFLLPPVTTTDGCMVTALF